MKGLIIIAISTVLFIQCKESNKEIAQRELENPSKHLKINNGNFQSIETGKSFYSGEIFNNAEFVEFSNLTVDLVYKNAANYEIGKESLFINGNFKRAINTPFKIEVNAPEHTTKAEGKIYNGVGKIILK